MSFKWRGSEINNEESTNLLSIQLLNDPRDGLKGYGHRKIEESKKMLKDDLFVIKN